MCVTTFQKTSKWVFSWETLSLHTLHHSIKSFYCEIIFICLKSLWGISKISSSDVIHLHIHTISDFYFVFFLPAFHAFGSCICVAFSLDYVFKFSGFFEYYSLLLVCEICSSAASRVVMFVIGHMLQLPFFCVWWEAFWVPAVRGGP